MRIADMLLPEFDMEMANTRKLLERIPEDKLGYQPHPKSMSLARLASHLVELPNLAVTSLTTDTFDYPADQSPLPQSRQELLAAFDKNVADARQKLAAATDERLMQMWTMTFGGKTVLSLPRSSMLRIGFMNHTIHHRAQLGVYLRLNNVPIPGMYGPSGDEA